MKMFRMMGLNYMPDNEQELSNYRIGRAQEELKGSKLLFANNLYKQAVNRSYYAIFHATRAVLALDKYDSKKHSGIISHFNHHYIAKNKIEKEYSKILMSAYKIRNHSDYDDFYIIDKEEAGNQLIHAEKFVNRIMEYLSCYK